METNFKMEFKQVSVEEIKLATYNPRKDLQPGDQEYEALRLSIKTHGFVDPLVLNTFNNVLIAGHQRLKVLTKEFGVKEVWCSCVNLPNKKHEIALNISLNHVHGEFDYSKLKDSLFEFKDDSLDDELFKSLGFQQMEFEQIMQWEGLTENDENKSPPSGKLEVYNQGMIKQIVLYFEANEYDLIISKFEILRKSLGVETNTELIQKLLEYYEQTSANKEITKS